MLYVIFIVVIFFFGCENKNKKIIISTDFINPTIQFGIEEIKMALFEKGIESAIAKDENAFIKFIIQPENAQLKAEGFTIKKENNNIQVIAFDKAGAMYGALELAEQIKLFGLEGIEETTQNPFMERRGTKFNIPLDVRTPSYSDTSDSAQKNIPEMWNFDFWTEYIDNLARYRYNFISLWNLHPFTSMVKVPGYEDVALNDVQRSTIKWEEFYKGNGVGFDAPEILENPEIVKKMTIDEKIEFWSKVMKYAKDRNVDFCILTWNIFVNGTDGKYGITDDVNNSVTRDYFRKSVKQMFVTYPHLAGIGLTTGENMPNVSVEEKENWAYETYAQGILDAAAEMPNRKFMFIHRQHQTGAKAIAEKFKTLVDNINIEFVFSFKYAQAHVYSATTQPYHENFVKEIGNIKTLWTLRNDDIYQFRWGAPDYVREFINNIPHDVSKGYYYGSDQWIWGRDFLMKDVEGKHPLEIVKHWYHWMQWGRLGYNPSMANNRFVSILQNKYPELDAIKLFIAWEEASMIYPVVTGFHWAPLDYHWYIEACKGRPIFTKNESGFHDVNFFINLPPHLKSGFQSIPDYIKMVEQKSKEGTSNLRNPFEVARMLHAHSDKATDILNEFSEVKNKELQQTLNDIKTMAALGKYYAFKIEGATNLSLYRLTKTSKYQEEAVLNLTNAYDVWGKYCKQATEQNINPFWTNRVGYVDWVKLTEDVKKDIDIAKLKHE